MLLWGGTTRPYRGGSGLGERESKEGVKRGQRRKERVKGLLGD